MRNHTIKRRTLLRGLLGGTAVSVGLPTLEAMLNGNGTALAQGAALPQRLGVFFWGNGVRLKFWNPAATGPGWALSPGARAAGAGEGLPERGLGHGHQDPRTRRATTPARSGILSGYPLRVAAQGRARAFRSTFSAPSIDQVVAAELGKTTRFQSLEVGISRRVNTREGTTLQFISHNGPDSANPPIYEPATVFNRLFGGDFKPPTAATRRPATRARWRRRRACGGACSTPSDGHRRPEAPGQRRRPDAAWTSTSRTCGASSAGCRSRRAAGRRRGGGRLCRARPCPAPSPTPPRASSSSRS